MKLKKYLKLASGLMLLFSATVMADSHVVKGVGVAFAPLVTFAEKGDAIRFLDMAAHFVESIKIPEGSEKMISEMGKDYSYTVNQPGVYFYKCPPHWGARMGGLIVVGEDGDDWIQTLEAYKEEIDDKTSKGFLRKIIKKAKKGEIKR